MIGNLPRNDELLRQISQITVQIPPNIYLSENLQENFKQVSKYFYNYNID